MILIDSSVWIFYYRPNGAKGIQELIREAISNDLIAVNGIIQVEIMSGISREAEFKMVESDFKGFHLFEINPNTFINSARMGSLLRKKGITIPSTDLIIAATAIENNSILYHINNHFDLIAEHTKLKVKNLGAMIK